MNTDIMFSSKTDLWETPRKSHDTGSLGRAGEEDGGDGVKCSGCYNCPVKGCTAAYRGSRCAHLRELAGVNTDPMTNADRIRAMPDEDIAKILASLQKKTVSLFTGRFVPPTDSDIKELVDWLRQPAEED